MPVQDLSSLVAVTFMVGSLYFMVDGTWLLVGNVNPNSTDFTGQDWMTSVVAIAGGVVFEVGCILLMMEMFDEHQKDPSSRAIEQNLRDANDGHDIVPTIAPAADPYYGRKTTNILRRSPTRRGLADKGGASGAGGSPNGSQRSWQYIATMHELRTHYVREMSFWAWACLCLGVTLFLIPNCFSTPPIKAYILARYSAAWYWAPQATGGLSLIICFVLFMLEVQEKWCKPAWRILGWWASLLNLLGAVAFLGTTICEVWLPAEWAVLWVAISVLFGATMFFVGSVVQYYDSVNKFPVEYINS